MERLDKASVYTVRNTPQIFHLHTNSDVIDKCCEHKFGNGNCCHHNDAKHEWSKTDPTITNEKPKTIPIQVNGNVLEKVANEKEQLTKRLNFLNEFEVKYNKLVNEQNLLLAQLNGK